MTSNGTNFLERLRAEGWLVGSHNDYTDKATGERRTYWMFTHHSGRWVDGDHSTDDGALGICYEKTRRIANISSVGSSLDPSRCRPERDHPGGEFRINHVRRATASYGG
jgi:hypothetical protein